MFGGGSRALWYMLGQWDAESERNAHRTADMFFGRSPVVEVRQSYIDSLHAALQNSNNISDQNYNTAVRYRDDALELKAQLDQANAIIAEQHACIERDKQEKKELEGKNSNCGGFLYVFTRTVESLVAAADAGKAGRADYQAFKQFVYQMFRAYHSEPDAPDCPVQISDEYFELEKSLKR